MEIGGILEIMHKLNDSLMVFGYGSLINQQSLRSTVPDAYNIQPAYIQGFRRDFNMWDAEGWKVTQPDVMGVPFCAVDVGVAALTDEVNGVVFAMSPQHFAALKQRENQYELIETPAYNFADGTPIGNCWVFSANKHNGSYVFNEPAQDRYLEIMLEAAAEHGAAFYSQFLATTYIDDTPLSAMSELIQNLHAAPEIEQSQPAIGLASA